MSLGGTALQIITLEEESGSDATSGGGSESSSAPSLCGNIRLERDNLRSIVDKIPKDTKVAIVSVVGGFRTGKSFLLTLLLRYLKVQGGPAEGKDWLHEDGETLSEGNCNAKSAGAKNGDSSSVSSTGGFQWRGGHERMTTGIWMWSEPFLRVDSETGERLAVLLMDTQGMFDNETTMTLTAQIFGMSTLISSLQIYNIQNRISEDHLQHLALFSEYGRIAHQRGDTTTNGETTEAVPSTAPKPFQRLQFLVRDWANFKEQWPESGEGADLRERESQAYSNLREEMQEYLDRLIRTRGDISLQSTRDQISRCFERVDCFMLPHPGIPITKPNYDGSIKVLDSSFCGLVDRFARLVFDEQLEPKRVHKRFITGIELANYFEAYVKLFQSGEGFPKAMTILEATAEANNRSAYDLALSKYIEIMGPISGTGANEAFMREADLKAKHEQAVEQAKVVFSDIATMGSALGTENMLQVLVKELASEIDKRLGVNALRNPFKEYEKYVIPTMVALICWILQSLLSATCHGSSSVCNRAKENLNHTFWLAIVFIAYVSWRGGGLLLQYLKMVSTDLAGLGSVKEKAN